VVICGIDYSVNSPAVVKIELDHNFDTIMFDYIGFTKVKKVAKMDEKIIHFTDKDFVDNLGKYSWIKQEIMSFVLDSKPSYAAIEGYALNAKGLVFNIAEATMCTKMALYENNIPLRIYDPNSIKKFATGHGNAGKVEMHEAFENFTELKVNLRELPELKSPREDLIVAFFIAKLLQLELKLRYGIIALRDLPLETITIFNRTTKFYPENILARPFIKRDGGECRIDTIQN
jgi:Holliday junction resolvasome RuvABC endonuclease subunit